MEIRHLRYFIAVADSGSVRSAAEKLHVTQPAISRQIHDLEDSLGFKLFHRTTHGLKLTEAGTVFLKEANNLLSQLNVAIQSAKLAAQGKQGQLRLGFVENAGWDGIVPNSFHFFQKVCANVSLELVPMYTPAQICDIEAGLLDGGFVYLFEPLPDNFFCMMLLEYPTVLAVPRRWGLPENVPIPLKDMMDMPFITFRRAVYPLYYDRLISACSLAGLTPNVVQEVSSESSILSLVSAGIGAAIVNAANCGRPPAQAQFLPLKAISLRLPLAFVCLKTNANPALENFIEALRSVGDLASGNETRT